LHDSQGVKISDEVLSGLGIETRNNFPLKKVVLNLVKNHHRLFDLYRNREEIGFKAVSRLVKDLEGYDFLLLLLDFADRNSREPNYLDFDGIDDLSQWWLDRKEEWNINHDTIQPLVMGRDLLTLGISPGPDMGLKLKQLYELQLDGAFDTRESGLELFKKLSRENRI